MVHEEPGGQEEKDDKADALQAVVDCADGEHFTGATGRHQSISRPFAFVPYIMCYMYITYIESIIRVGIIVGVLEVE